MKTMILMLPAALSFNAYYIWPVQLDPSVVVRLTVGGGFPFPGSLQFRQITLTRDGVVKVGESRNNEAREYTLATVPPQDMLEIGRAIGQLSGGHLSKADRPPCADAPTYSYIVNMNGAPILIYRVAGCIDEQLTDKKQRPAATALKTYLDQLNQMAH